jgi:hypothetical protein
MIRHAPPCFDQAILNCRRHGACMPLIVASKMPLPATVAVLPVTLTDSARLSMSILW